MMIRIILILHIIFITSCVIKSETEMPTIPTITIKKQF
jgi:hypothetical protein